MTDRYRLRPEELRPFELIRDFLEPKPEDLAALGPEASRLWARVHEANGSATIDTVERALRLEPTIDADWLTAQLLSRQSDSTAVARPRRFRAMSLAELRQRPRPSYIVDRLLQADTVAVLEGIDGTYKSFLALAWAHCVALGKPWLERPVQEGRVLYLLGEGSRGLPRRADAWQIVNLGGRRDVIDNLGFVVDEMPQLWQADASEVIATNPGPFALVIVDTLARALVGGNENSQDDMGKLVEGCEQLRRAYDGACVLILHHLNHQGGLRGSTSLPGAVSTRLRLERRGTSRVVSLQTKKQRDAEPEDSITLVGVSVDLGEYDDQNRMVTSLVLEPADDSGDDELGPDPTTPVLAPQTQHALAVLVDLGEAAFGAWHTATAAYGKPKMAESSFKRARRELLTGGFVKQEAEQYHATERGKVQGAGGAKQGAMALDGPSAIGGAGHGHTPIRSGRPAPSPAPTDEPDKEDLPW